MRARPRWHILAMSSSLELSYLTPMPHTYDSLTVGDSFSWSRTLTMSDVRAFADVTGDDNPIHIDERSESVV